MNPRYVILNGSHYTTPDEGQRHGSMAFVCTECGSFVLDRVAHDNWHEAFDDLRARPLPSLMPLSGESQPASDGGQR